MNKKPCFFIATNSNESQIKNMIGKQGLFEIDEDKLENLRIIFNSIDGELFQTSRIEELQKITKELFMIITKNSHYIFKLIEEA